MVSIAPCRFSIRQMLFRTVQVEWRWQVATKATAQHYSTVWISLSCLPAAPAPARGVGAQSAGTGGAEQGGYSAGRGATYMVARVILQVKMGDSVGAGVSAWQAAPTNDVLSAPCIIAGFPLDAPR